ncbi:MAG: cyclic 2,3-diphosphoglycerate synthase [Planctomycetota bacterium]
MAVRTLILGAAGRDFHNFNMVYRGDPDTRVVGFTATQIPDIADKVYPPELAGDLYPDGIPIYPEEELEKLVGEHAVERVVFAYSDISHEHVMHLACRTLAAGADFALLGPNRTALHSRLPVVAVCAVRTGSGKSPVSRAVVQGLVSAGKRVAVIRHPMPYGDLTRQRLQRFERLEDLDAAECTIEEREEYEPHIMAGTVVYAGADYEAILEAAERDADVVLWDGGNNDLPFIRPSLHCTLVDPHRAGHETLYYPGEANFRAADLLVITKVGTAPPEGLEALRNSIAWHRPGVPVVEGNLRIELDCELELAGKKVLCVEDGPTTSHGGMNYGSAVIAARQAGAEVVDPRPHATGSLITTFEENPHLTTCLPAMGYSGKQIQELEESIRRTPCEAVIIGTPIDLRRIIPIDQPSVRAIYSWEDRGARTLANVILEGIGAAAA